EPGAVQDDRDLAREELDAGPAPARPVEVVVREDLEEVDLGEVGEQRGRHLGPPADADAVAHHDPHPPQPPPPQLLPQLLPPPPSPHPTKAELAQPDEAVGWLARSRSGARSARVAARTRSPSRVRQGLPAA